MVGVPGADIRLALQQARQDLHLEAADLVRDLLREGV
jgi:hypothetical protein